MRSRLVLAIVVVAAVSFLAADNAMRMNVKEGLWETTVTHTMTGMPGIPADALAKMPPEQRAMIEERMKASGMGGGPKTEVNKTCVTREKLDKQMAFADNRENCKRTVVSATPSHFEMKFHCEQDKAVTDGTFTAEISGGDDVKGSSHIVSKSEGHNVNMDFTFTSRYLGPACGDVK
jgi:hypothetical protein